MRIIYNIKGTALINGEYGADQGFGGQADRFPAKNALFYVSLRRLAHIWKKWVALVMTLKGCSEIFFRFTQKKRCFTQIDLCFLSKCVKIWDIVN